MARAAFLKNLVRENLDWIGLTRDNRSAKVLDYGAGTGLLSRVGFCSVCETKGRV